MDFTHIAAPEDMRSAVFDTLARSLHDRLPRRRVAGLMAAAFATGVFGISSHATNPVALDQHRCGPPSCGGS